MKKLTGWNTALIALAIWMVVMTVKLWPQPRGPLCDHTFGRWEIPGNTYYKYDAVQIRICSKCGWAEKRSF